MIFYRSRVFKFKRLINFKGNIITFTLFTPFICILKTRLFVYLFLNNAGIK